MELLHLKKRGRRNEELYPNLSFNQQNKWWAKAAVIIQDNKQPMKLQIFLSHSNYVKTALANLFLQVAWKVKSVSVRQTMHMLLLVQYFQRTLFKLNFTL